MRQLLLCYRNWAKNGIRLTVSFCVPMHAPCMHLHLVSWCHLCNLGVSVVWSSQGVGGLWHYNLSTKWLTAVDCSLCCSDMQYVGPAMDAVVVLRIWWCAGKLLVGFGVVLDFFYFFIVGLLKNVQFNLQFVPPSCCWCVGGGVCLV